MDATAARALLKRLGAFLDQFAGGFGRRAQREYASRYVQGLLNDSERKSMQAMHGRLSDAGSYQGLQNFITHSTWEVTPFWRRLRAAVPVRHGILAVDDTGLPKQGKHSVGVHHQYCGALGKEANCQAAVSTALIADGMAWLTSLELYLPTAWTEDASRRAAATVPPRLVFREKWRIAIAHIRQVLAAGLTIDAVVADAAYGEVGGFRAQLERLGLRYVVAIPSRLAAHLGPRLHASVDVIIDAQPRTAWRRIRWGRGTKGPLEARFVAVRVRPRSSRGERWLLCQESLSTGERKYYFSNLAPETPLKTLVAIARSRWAIEIQYRDLKSELGLDHFEGRSYPGWHHHAVLAAMTFTFLQLERLRGTDDPLPTFPEIRNLVREILVTLFLLERPSWLNLLASFQRNPPLRI